MVSEELSVKPMASVPYLLQHVASVMQRQSDQILQERLGVGISQYKILLILQERPESGQRQLADSLGQTEASISRQVKILQEKAMLASHTDPDERRRHLAVLTARGAKVLQAAQAVIDDYYQPLLAVLGAKQRGKLHDMLVALHEQTCAPGRPMACTQQSDIAAIYDLQHQG